MNNKNIVISYGELFSPTAMKKSNLNSILTSIRSPKKNTVPMALLAIRNASTKAEKNAIKAKLPVFGMWDSNVRENNAINTITGMIFDFDYVDEPAVLKNAIAMSTLAVEKKIAAIFISPSGHGVKVIIPFSEPMKRNVHGNDFEKIYKNTYKAIRHTLEQDCGFDADATVDIARIAYVSFDPDIIIFDDVIGVQVIAPVAAPITPTIAPVEKSNVLQKITDGANEGNRNTSFMEVMVYYREKNVRDKTVLNILMKNFNDKCQPPYDEKNFNKTFEDMFNRFIVQKELDDPIVALANFQKENIIYSDAGKYILMRKNNSTAILTKVNICELLNCSMKDANEAQLWRKIPFAGENISIRTFFAEEKPPAVISDGVKIDGIDTHVGIMPADRKDNELIFRYLSHTFGERAGYILDWLAQYTYANTSDMAKYTTKRLPILVLVGKRNTGKGAFSQFVQAIFGDKHAVNISTELLESQFNNWYTKKLVIADEVANSEKIRRTLKQWQGTTSSTVNEKGKNIYTAQVAGGMIVISNDTAPINIPTQDMVDEVNSPYLYLLFDENNNINDFAAQDEKNKIRFIMEAVPHFARAYLPAVWEQMKKKYINGDYRYGMKSTITEHQMNVAEASRTQTDDLVDAIAERIIGRAMNDDIAAIRKAMKSPQVYSAFTKDDIEALIALFPTMKQSYVKRVINMKFGSWRKITYEEKTIQVCISHRDRRIRTSSAELNRYNFIFSHDGTQEDDNPTFAW